MDEIRVKLDEEIEGVLSTMKNMSPDDPKYSGMADNLAKLYEVRLNEKKLDAEIEDKKTQQELKEYQIDKDFQAKTDQIDSELEYRKAELEIKSKQIDTESSQKEVEIETKKAEAKNRAKEVLISAGLGLVGIVVPLIFNGVWLGRGFKFEETGAFTSTTLRTLVNKMRHKK
jgi:hypothetical protein